jgi:hypothetical protein
MKQRGRSRSIEDIMQEGRMYKTKGEWAGVEEGK